MGGFVFRVLPGEGLVEQGAVLDAAAQGTHGIQGPAQRIDPAAADAADGGFQSRDAAEGGGYAHRPARIAPQAHGCQAGGHGDRGAAGGSPRHVVHGIPGIVRRPQIVVDAHAPEGELHRVGFSQQHHPGLRAFSHHVAIGCGDVVLQQPRAGHGGFPLYVEEVLRHIGYSVQRAQILAGLQGRFGRPCFSQGAFPGHGAEGAQFRIQPVDASDQVFGQIDGAQRSVPKTPSQFGNV